MRTPSQNAVRGMNVLLRLAESASDSWGEEEDLLDAIDYLEYLCEKFEDEEEEVDDEDET